MVINPQDELRAQRAVETELLDGEKILWAGQPDASKIFTAADILLIPFTLLWTSFPALGLLAGMRSNESDPLFSLFLIPFIAVGLYILIGRFFYKSWAKRRTYYAITDRRVIVISGGRKRRVIASFIRDIPTVNSSIGKNNMGRIIFGNTSPYAASFGNTGMDFTGNNSAPLPPIFYDLENAQEVLDLVNRLRDEQCR